MSEWQPVIDAMARYIDALHARMKGEYSHSGLPMSGGNYGDAIRPITEMLTVILSTEAHEVSLGEINDLVEIIPSPPQEKET